jgi:hypothetical protein
MSYVCDVPGMNTQDISQPEVSYTPGMITAEAKGHVRRMGSAAVYGHERSLLEYVIEHAEAGNVSSVLTAMDSFWSKTFNAEGADNWETRSANIEANVQRQVKNKAHLNDFKGGAVSCLELGTYCGYSALLIARNLQPGSMLVRRRRRAPHDSVLTQLEEPCYSTKKTSRRRTRNASGRAEARAPAGERGTRPALRRHCDQDHRVRRSGVKGPPRLRPTRWRPIPPHHRAAGVMLAATSTRRPARRGLRRHCRGSCPCATLDHSLKFGRQFARWQVRVLMGTAQSELEGITARVGSTWCAPSLPPTARPRPFTIATPTQPPRGSRCRGGGGSCG